MTATVKIEHPVKHLSGEAGSRHFRSALGTFTTGVAVVTVMGPHGPAGITVNSFASVSLDPPLVLWSIDRKSARHVLFTATRHYVIHILGADQNHLGSRFTRGGAGFDGLDWSPNGDGAPLLANPLARFECARSALHDEGDHTIIIGRVLRAAYREGEPLCFSRGMFGQFTPGHHALA
jgi:flavin reductase (DIM6/NTAB) family NADH-FMN oxidoreductase RutF